MILSLLSGSNLVILSAASLLRIFSLTVYFINLLLSSTLDLLLLRYFYIFKYFSAFEIQRENFWSQKLHSSSISKSIKTKITMFLLFWKQKIKFYKILKNGNIMYYNNFPEAENDISYQVFFWNWEPEAAFY